jgi:phosphatidylserine/phosphatidylglycerophosphate/cardiolipin synthase-like enzyme
MTDIRHAVVRGGVSILATKPSAEDWPRLLDIPTFSGPFDLHAGVSPEGSWTVLERFIASAETELWISIYNLTGRHIVDALKGVLDRNVRVRLLYDARDGQGGEVEKVQELKDHGGDRIEVRKCPSVTPRAAFAVCHQKFALADGRDVFLGSANWAGTAIPQVADPLNGPWPTGNREWVTAVYGHQGMADLFRELFDLDWDWQPSGPGIAAVVEEPAVREMSVILAKKKPPAKRFAPFDGQTSGGARITPVISPQNYLETVSALLRGARDSICVQQQYITIEKPDAHVVKLLAILREKAETVDVKVVVSPKYPENTLKTKKALESFGLGDRLRFLDLQHFEHCHNKGVLVDGRAVVVSSTNWSDNSIGAAREAGLLIEDGEVAGYFQKVFDADWAAGLSP